MYIIYTLALQRHHLKYLIVSYMIRPRPGHDELGKKIPGWLATLDSCPCPILLLFEGGTVWYRTVPLPVLNIGRYGNPGKS